VKLSHDDKSGMHDYLLSLFTSRILQAMLNTRTLNPLNAAASTAHTTLIHDHDFVTNNWFNLASSTHVGTPLPEK